MSDFPSNLRYTKTHEWSFVDDYHLIRVGITDFAQEELGDLVFIQLPDVDSRVTAGEKCAVVESVKTASDLYAPVSGEIVDINDMLSTDPQLVNYSPYITWIFKIRADNISDLEKLMSAEEYQRSIQN
jgi:glycine cleavage system H protein